jgi:hypothetical protein
MPQTAIDFFKHESTFIAIFGVAYCTNLRYLLEILLWNPMIPKTLYSFCMLFICWQLSFTQTDQYYHGIAVDKNVNEARTAAYNALIQQIQVVVSSNFKRNQSETNNSYTDETNISTVARSTMSLTDVTEKVETLPDKTYRVTKTVPKESVRKMFNDRMQKIFDHLREAQSIAFPKGTVKNIPLHSSLINFYQAYLLAILYPDTISFPTGREQKLSSVMVGIPNTIDQISSSIKFKPVKMIDDEFIVWKFRVEYQGIPVQSMRYSYFDGMGQSDGEVTDGETQITLFYPKSEKKERTLNINLEYLYESEMDEVLKMGYSSNAVSRMLKIIPVKIPADAVIKAETPKPPQPLAVFQDKDITPDNLKKELDRLSRKGMIVTGKASDFETLHGLYCLVIDRSGLKAFMKNEHNKYFDYLTESQRELKEFSGMKIIWMEALK